MSSQSGMDKREHNQKVLSILPNDVWIQIFTFFNEKELCRSINRVCKQFYELSESDILWYFLYLRVKKAQLRQFALHKRGWKKIYLETRLNLVYHIYGDNQSHRVLSIDQNGKVYRDHLWHNVYFCRKVSPKKIPLTCSPSSVYYSVLRGPELSLSYQNHVIARLKRVKLKCLLLGEISVGKQSLIDAIVLRNTINEIGKVDVNNAHVGLQVDGNPVLMELQQCCTLDNLSKCETPNVVLLCFSLVDEKSFHALHKWYEKAKQIWENVRFLLVGTKLDLCPSILSTDTGSQIIVPYKEAEEFKTRIKAIDYIECSSKTYEEVLRVFIQASKPFVPDFDERTAIINLWVCGFKKEDYSQEKQLKCIIS